MENLKHFKLYKAGKKWCLMAITITAMTAGILTTANADTIDPNSTNATRSLVQTSTVENSTIKAVDSQNVNQNNSSNNVDSKTVETKLEDPTMQTKGPVSPLSTTSVPKAKIGWQKETQGWTFYDQNGKTTTGRVYSYLPTITANGTGAGNNWYLTDNGVVLSGVQKWADTYYDFDPNTYLRVDNDYRQSQWGNWYMFGGDGRIVSGFLNWYGSLYFFDPTTYLKLTNTYFNGNGYWNNWDTYWADNNGVVHGVRYFSQFTPVWAGWGCAGAALTMLLSIRNIWPGVGNVIAGIPQGGNGGQIGNQYNGAGFSRVIQPNALAAYGRRWYGAVTDSSGATINQIANSVLNGHPVLYYGYSPYDAGGVRNHCKIILGYNRNNGMFHVYDPCYGNGGWGANSEGHTAYDRGWNAWISWGQLANEYGGQAITIY